MLAVLNCNIRLKNELRLQRHVFLAPTMNENKRLITSLGYKLAMRLLVDSRRSNSVFDGRLHSAKD